MKNLRWILAFAVLSHGFPTRVRASPFVIEWDAIEGAAQYEIQVFTGKKVVQRKRLPAKNLSWTADLSFGVYAYQLRAIDSHRRPGDWSDPQSFLVAPPPAQLLSPADGSALTLTDDNPLVKLKWQMSDNVERYLVEVRRGKKMVYEGIVSGNEAVVPNLENGRYTWVARPILESLSPVSNVSQINVVTPPELTSWAFSVTTHFDPKKEAVAKREVAMRGIHASEPVEPALWIGIADALVPYHYEVVSPVSQVSGSGNGLSNQLGLDAEYPLGHGWSVAGVFQGTFTHYGGYSGCDKRGALAGKVRLPLADGFPGWFLTPQFGAEYRDFSEVVQNPPGTVTGPGLQSRPGLLGPKVGVEFGRLVPSSWSLSLAAEYLFPVVLFGEPGSHLAQDDPYRNLRLGLQGSFWLDESWVIGAGVFGNLSSVSFLSPGQTAPERIRMDTVQFQLSLTLPVRL